MLKIYGIPNCDTMKKARRWLEANGIEYDFHDYRKLDVPEKNLKNWVTKTGWETVLNKRGTTWRKLDDAIKDSIDEATAIQLMIDNPSIIKRPVIESGKLLVIGFNDDQFKRLIP